MEEEVKELTKEELVMPEEGVEFKPVKVRGELVEDVKRFEELVNEQKWVNENPGGVTVGIEPAE